MNRLFFLILFLSVGGVKAQTIYSYRIPTDKKCEVIYYFYEKYDAKKEEGKKYTWTGKCGKDNLIEGYGTLTELLPNGDKVITTATYMNGKEEGSGTSEFESKEGKRIFSGTYRDGWKSYGTQSYHNYTTNLKSIYEGPFYNSKFSGKGSLLLQGQNPIYRYEGNFVNGIRDGWGSIYYFETHVKWVGNFTMGKKNGTGTLYGDEGSIETVQFVNDQEVYRQ